MVEAAAADWPGLEPCRMEIDRGGPTYTVDTVRQLRRDHPDAELILVVGIGRGGRPDHLEGRARPSRPGHTGRRGPAGRPAESPRRRAGGP